MLRFCMKKDQQAFSEWHKQLVISAYEFEFRKLSASCIFIYENPTKQAAYGPRKYYLLMTLLKKVIEGSENARNNS